MADGGVSAAVEDAVGAAIAGGTAVVRIEAPTQAGLTNALQSAAARHGSELDVVSAGGLGSVDGFAVARRLLQLPEPAAGEAGGGRRSFFEAGVSGAAEAVAVESLLRQAEAAVGRQPRLWIVDDAELAGAGTWRWLTDVVASGTLPVALVYGTHDPGLARLGDEPTVRLTSERALADPGRIAARLGELIGSGQVLGAAAVAGARFAVADVAAVLGEPLHRCLADFAALVSAGVIVADGSDYRFVRRHEWEAALGILDRPVRSALHAAYAQLLMERGDHPARVAEHLMTSGTRVRGDVEWLTAAAEQCVGLDAHLAVAITDRALALTTEPPRRLRVVHARALSTVGRVAEAEALIHLLLADATGDEQAALRRDLAMSYFHQGRAGETVAVLDTAAAVAEDPSMKARLTADLAMAYLLAGQYPTGREVAAEGARLGERAGDVTTVVAAEMVGLLVAWYQLELDEAVRLADHLQVLSELPEAAEAALYQPWFAGSLLRLEMGEFDHARRLNALGRAHALESGHHWASPVYDALDAYVAWEQGDFDRAVASATGALAWRLEDKFGAEIWCQAFLGRIALARGDVATAQHRLELGQALVLPAQAQLGLDHLAMLEADLAIHRGDRQAACEVLVGGWMLMSALAVRAALPRLCVELAPLLADGSRPEVREHVLADVRAAAVRTGFGHYQTDVDYVEGRLANDWGALDAAAGRYAELGRAYRAASTWAEAAVLAAAHDLSTARRLARQAQPILDGLGPDGDLATIRHLCGAGRRRGPRGLSPSEAQVIELVAAGLTNIEIAERLVLSRRTVESHVSSAYRKFGVGNRVELAQAFAGH